ncbi:MAG: DMT family transporter [Bdellovibrionales bacterium]|nr:DMT family transporter [Bdellovibrionales bacterium]
MSRYRSGAWYIFVSTTCFAFVSLSVKLLSHIPSEHLVFWRGLICLAISYTVLKKRRVPVWGNNKVMLTVRGLAGTVALSCFFYTLHAIPLATAVTLQYLSPILTVIVAGLVFKEGVSTLHWLCGALGFLGVWMIEGFDTRVSLTDAGIGVLGALAAAFAYNSVRSLRHTENEWVVMFYFQLTATVLIAPWALNSWAWPKLSDWPLIVAIGLLTQVAQLYLTRGYQLDKASKVAPIGNIGVLYAVLFGVVMFGETLPLTTLAGMTIILASVLLTSWRKA